MKKIIILMFILLLGGSHIIAQAPFNKVFDNFAMNHISLDIDYIADSSYYIAYSYRHFDYNGNLFTGTEILKIDSTGNIFQSKYLTQNYTDKWVTGSALINNYLYVVVKNRTYDSTDYNNYIYNETYNADLIKFTLNLDTVWTISMSDQEIFANGMGKNKQDELFIYGSNISASQSQQGMAYITKMDTNGGIKWNYCYNVDDSYFHKIQPTLDGGCIAGGHCGKYIGGNNILLRVDSTGQLVWDTLIYDPGAQLIEGLIQTQDSNFVALGATLTKFDINKHIIWTRQYNDTNYGYFNQVIKSVGPLSLFENHSGNLLFMTNVYHDPFETVVTWSKLYYLTPEGEVLHTRIFRSEPYGIPAENLYDMVELPDHSYTFWGYMELDYSSQHYYSLPYQHLWMVHTDSSFNDGFSTIDTLTRLSFLPPDTMCFDDTVNVQVQVINTTYTGNYNICFDILSDNYNFDHTDTFYNISADSVFNFKLTSYNPLCDSLIIFYAIIPSDSLSRPTIYNPYPPKIVYFINCDTNAIEVLPLSQPCLSIYPNPSNKNIMVEITSPEARQANAQLRIMDISILDIMGKQVKSIKTKGQSEKYIVNIEDLPAGIYFVKVKTNNGEIIKKFVKQ